MSKLDELNAKFDKLIRVMEKRHETSAAPAPTKNGVVEIANAEFSEFINKIGKGLMRAGFIPQGLDQRYAATGIETLGKSNTSVSGSVSTIYGLREVKRDIAQDIFNLTASPAFNNQIAAANDSWNVATCNVVKASYDKMYNMLKKIQDLLPSLKF